MSFTDPYLITEYLHPRAAVCDPAFDEAIHPNGYVEYISRLGRGSFCRGLTVHTPESRSYWQGPNKDELLVMRLEQGFWEPSVLKPSDLEQCMVVADSDTSDSYVTCPRFGKQIFELPRQDTEIRIIGEDIDDLLVDYARRSMVDYSYFDPWPYCSRRGFIRFVTHPDFGFDALLKHIEQRWGLHDQGCARYTEPDVYQERFIPKLHAHVGFHLRDQRPAICRLPDGCVTVTMILDTDSVPAAIEFANEHMIPDHAHLDPNIPGVCEEHTVDGR